MGQRSVSEIIKQFEPLLRKYEKDENLVLLDAQEELGTKAGENYMSIVIRTKIVGKRGDGRVYKKSFMRKKQLENAQLAKLVRNEDLFRIESYAYAKLLPLLGPFGPDCILVEPHEIIMEDLGARNFSICSKRTLLDIDHCMAVVQTLASMHSSSLSIKLKSPEKFAELVAPLCENILRGDQHESFSTFLENSLRFAQASLQSINPKTPMVLRAIDFAASYCNKVTATMEKLLVSQLENDRYAVITHGDTWKNNILFLHDANGKVVRVKLVDFQVVRHSSPAIDFTYFLYSSARSEVLERDINDLIRTYERFFVHDLRRLDAPEKDLKILSKPGWFKEELRRYGLFGFFGALMVLHAIFIDEGSAAKLEITKTQEEYNIEDYALKETPEKTERILFIIDHYIRTFVCNNVES